MYPRQTTPPEAAAVSIFDWRAAFGGACNAPCTRTLGEKIPSNHLGPNTIRHVTIDPVPCQLWFGTDQAATHRVSVPQITLWR